MKLNIIYLLLALAVLGSACNSKPEEEVTDQEEQVQLQDTVVKEIVEESDDAFVFKRNKNKHPQNYFINPFDSAILLAGTFCELRSNHFHGGLDIRTGGYEGWKVKSVAKGYVSRIKVSPYGYGNALYITHTNGYTSVYGHLKSFEGEIAEYLEKAQYDKRSFEIELFPGKALPVTQGQIVALSGNTGGSGGPHLHFEIRDRSGQAINPLLAGLDVVDSIPPLIKQVLVYYKDKKNLLHEGGYPMKKLKSNMSYFRGTPLVLKPGTYSFGILSKDFFTDMRNRLGVNYCWLTADDRLLYQYQIERMNFELGRYINTHIDPYLHFKTGVKYVRLFKENYNKYPYYKQNKNAEVYLRHGDTVNMKVFVEDYSGMRDSLVWTIVGDTSANKLPWTKHYAADTTFRAKAGRTTHFTYGEWKMSIPGNSIYHDIDIKLGKGKYKPGVLGSVLRMHYGYTPLHKHIQVSYGLNKSQESWGKQLCAVSFSGKRKIYEGGAISNGRLHFKTRSFGEYALAIDSTAPRIRVERLSRRLRFRISDNLSGIATYKLSIDDKWILMKYEPKLSLLFGEIPDWIKAGKHELKLVVADDRGNRKELIRNITL